jgi:CRP/FNR family transcriptional regulator
MLSPYGLTLIESCLTCKMRSGRIFCDLPESSLRDFEAIKYAAAYPNGAVLFIEGQEPRGIYILCSGSVKVSVGAEDGKTVIVRIATPGEVLGLAATVSGKPYDVTAVTMTPCQINFLKRDDFLRLIKRDAQACLKVAEQLSEKYNTACQQVRSLGTPRSATGRLAALLLQWTARNGESYKPEPRLRMALTHEEIAQILGASRETVTRVFGELRAREIVRSQGSILVIRNKHALKALAA